VVVRGSILVIRWLTRADGRILAVQHCPSEGYVNRSTVSVDCFGQHALVGMISLLTGEGGGPISSSSIPAFCRQTIVMHWQCRHRQGCPLSNFVFWEKSDIADGIVLLAGIPTKQFTAEFIDPMAQKAVVYSSSFRMISWIIASTFEFSVLSYQRWKPESCTLRGKWSGNHEIILKRNFENFRTVMSTVAFRKHAHTQRMRKKRAGVVMNAVKTLCAGKPWEPCEQHHFFASCLCPPSFSFPLNPLHQHFGNKLKSWSELLLAFIKLFFCGAARAWPFSLPLVCSYSAPYVRCIGAFCLVMCGCEHVVQVHSKRCELWTISNFKFDPGAFLSCVMGSSRKRYEFGVRIWKKVISASEILGEILYSSESFRIFQETLY